MNQEDTVTLQDIQVLARQESAKMHHFFIGVEHLFIALTQLEGGLTRAMLEYHKLSPRFVRYSIRESVGRYENRRYWPGYPETPRVTTVLDLAKQFSATDELSERDLLLAILDENDSVVIRVLNEMGADLAALRETAMHWEAPLRPQPRDIPIRGAVNLDPEQVRVLQLMFRDYSEVEILREFDGGHSGARVLLVRPIQAGGHRDAPVVAKLDERQAILYERRRYDLHVKGTLPASTARLLDAPVAPDKSWVAGLKYTFVGRVEDSEPMSLRDLAQRDPLKLGGLIRALFDEFGPTWWLQRHPYRFNVWREYEHVLPPALVVEAVPDDNPGAMGHVLTPLGTWSRNNQVMAGELVALNGFVVQKINFEKDVLHLAAGAQPEAINRASKVEVRGLGLNGSTFLRGETVDQIVGRVVSTRDDLLRRSLQALEPNFDLRAEEIMAPQANLLALPNPLYAINELLERQVNGHLSVIHGDLHLGNVLVGPRGDAWLIDFAWTREGHTLFDWAMLEASLLVEVIAPLATPGWGGAWDVVQKLNMLNRGDDSVLQDRHPIGRALTGVKAIRDIVRDHLMASARWGEYYVALSLLSLRLMDWQSETINARRLAFLVSALALSSVQSSPRDVPTRTESPWMETPTDVDVRADGRSDDAYPFRDPPDGASHPGR